MSTETERRRSGWKYIEKGLHRAKIPGGWLVKLTIEVNVDPGEGAHWYSETRAVSLTFVPDPEHKWDGSMLP